MRVGRSVLLLDSLRTASTNLPFTVPCGRNLNVETNLSSFVRRAIAIRVKTSDSRIEYYGKYKFNRLGHFFLIDYLP